MMKQIFAAAATVVLFSASALASHCPTDVKAVTEALAHNTSLSAEQKLEVQSLADQGAKQHTDGDHGGSIDTLHKARQILGIDH